MRPNNIPKDVQDAFAFVLESLWADELYDFNANPAEHHIFRRLVTLHNWFYEECGTAETYVEQEFEDDLCLFAPTQPHQGG